MSDADDLSDAMQGRRKRRRLHQQQQEQEQLQQQEDDGELDLLNLLDEDDAAELRRAWETTAATHGPAAATQDAAQWLPPEHSIPPAAAAAADGLQGEGGLQVLQGMAGEAAPAGKEEPWQLQQQLQMEQSIPTPAARAVEEGDEPSTPLADSATHNDQQQQHGAQQGDDFTLGSPLPSSEAAAAASPGYGNGGLVGNGLDLSPLGPLGVGWSPLPLSPLQHLVGFPGFGVDLEPLPDPAIPLQLGGEVKGTAAGGGEEGAGAGLGGEEAAGAGVGREEAAAAAVGGEEAAAVAAAGKAGAEAAVACAVAAAAAEVVPQHREYSPVAASGGAALLGAVTGGTGGSARMEAAALIQHNEREQQQQQGQSRELEGKGDQDQGLDKQQKHQQQQQQHQQQQPEGVEHEAAVHDDVEHGDMVRQLQQHQQEEPEQQQVEQQDWQQQQLIGWPQRQQEQQQEGGEMLPAAADRPSTPRPTQCRSPTCCIPLAVKAGVFFTLYCLHATQLHQTPVPIYIPAACLKAFAASVDELVQAGAGEAVAAVGKLHAAAALIAGGASRPRPSLFATWEPVVVKPQYGSATAAADPGGRGGGVEGGNGMGGRKRPPLPPKLPADPKVMREGLFHLNTTLQGLSNYRALQGMCDKYAEARGAIFRPLLGHAAATPATAAADGCAGIAAEEVHDALPASGGGGGVLEGGEGVAVKGGKKRGGQQRGGQEGQQKRRKKQQQQQEPEAAGQAVGRPGRGRVRVPSRKVLEGAGYSGCSDEESKVDKGGDSVLAATTTTTGGGGDSISTAVAAAEGEELLQLGGQAILRPAPAAAGDGGGGGGGKSVTVMQQDEPDVGAVGRTAAPAVARQDRRAAAPVAPPELFDTKFGVNLEAFAVDESAEVLRVLRGGRKSKKTKGKAKGPKQHDASGGGQHFVSSVLGEELVPMRSQEQQEVVGGVKGGKKSGRSGKATKAATAAAAAEAGRVGSKRVLRYAPELAAAGILQQEELEEGGSEGMQDVGAKGMAGGRGAATAVQMQAARRREMLQAADKWFEAHDVLMGQQGVAGGARHGDAAGSGGGEIAEDDDMPEI